MRFIHLPQVDLTVDKNTVLQDTFITIAGYQKTLQEEIRKCCDNISTIMDSLPSLILFTQKLQCLLTLEIIIFEIA